MQAAQKSTRQDFQIKCQCSIVKQGIKLNLKKKSKFSIITLTPDNFLSIIPFGIAQQPDNTHRFDLKKLKNIHKKYIAEGKITLQFLQRMERQVIRGNFVLASDQKVEIVSRVFIDNASKQNLQLLIQKILQLKKVKNPGKQDNKDKNEPQIKQINTKKAKLTNEGALRSQSPPLDRKKLRELALKDPYPKKKITQQPKFQEKKKTYHLLLLPPDILQNIFSYCPINLCMRVISKQFSQYILRNIKTIRFNDLVPQETFNKLAKYAINVQCRMKNVHSLDLQNKNQQIVLMKNVAKTLKFGKWKQIKGKNIAQLKGLKIYCLEIPFMVKFNFGVMMGIKLVQLRLKGKSSIRNSYVNDDIIQYANSIKTLKVLQIPYADANLLLQLQNRERFTQIKIGTLDCNSEDFSWSDLTKYPNLQVFGIQEVTKQGIIKNWNIHFMYPDKLLQCEIGNYIAQESLEILPQSIRRLKITGDKYYNNVVLKINIPQLKFLDISQCKYLGSDCLMNLQQATILTNWQKQTTLAAQDRFSLRNLLIIPRK